MQNVNQKYHKERKYWLTGINGYNWKYQNFINNS